MNAQRSPRIKCMREWGSISAPMLHSPEDPELAAEGGTNTHPSRAAESHKNMCSGIVLEGGYASEGGLNGCT